MDREQLQMIVAMRRYQQQLKLLITVLRQTVLIFLLALGRFKFYQISAKIYSDGLR